MSASDKALCKMAKILAILSGSEKSLGAVYYNSLIDEEYGRWDKVPAWSNYDRAQARAIFEEFKI